MPDPCNNPIVLKGTTTSEDWHYSCLVDTNDHRIPSTCFLLCFMTVPLASVALWIMRYERQDLHQHSLLSASIFGRILQHLIRSKPHGTLAGYKSEFWSRLYIFLFWIFSVVLQGVQRCERLCGMTRSLYAIHTCRSYRSGTGCRPVLRRMTALQLHHTASGMLLNYICLLQYRRDQEGDEVNQAPQRTSGAVSGDRESVII